MSDVMASRRRRRTDVTDVQAEALARFGDLPEQMGQTTHRPEPPQGTQSTVPPAGQAVVTFAGADKDRRGCFKAITRLGKTVVVHDRLTEADLQEIQADPTRAHARAWSMVSIRGGRNR